MSCCGRFIWAKEQAPASWATKFSVDVFGNIVKGPDEGNGVETNVTGDDGILMPAMIADIELQPVFAIDVTIIGHSLWRTLDEEQIRALGR